MEIIDNKYRIENIRLGSGGFSEVFLGSDLNTGQKVAIKKISLHQKPFQQTNGLNKLNLEIELIKKLNHPNIVTCYDVFKTTTHWYIIMEYCNYGTMEDVIKYNEIMAKKDIHFNRETNTYYYLNQLKEALYYMRTNGCIHRDIKPMNILLTKNNLNIFSSLNDSGTIFKSDEQINSMNDAEQNKDRNFDHGQNLVVKLADFGLAKHYTADGESLMNTICGSPLYMAPELIFENKYNSKADLWSFGIIMYQMLFGVHPNIANNIEQLMKNLKFKNIDFHLNKNFSPHCFDLLTKLLTKNPSARISWTELFNHKWFDYWKNINYSKRDLIIYKIPPDATSIKQNKQNIMSDELLENQNNTDGLVGSENEISVSPAIEISKNSPLGFSNLSKMKWDGVWSRNSQQGSYADYPASYPPTDPRRVLIEKYNVEQHNKISNIPKDKTGTQPINIPKNSFCNYQRESRTSHSYGTPVYENIDPIANSVNLTNNFRSRIFRNLKKNESISNLSNLSNLSNSTNSTNSTIIEL
ncbi:MAG: putative serine threonine-protein kinase [Satyrvirus sp.]|uniref:Putative serine threonine-protein kinase n=1 Tax=Satyrvirus sp. TaxID=2487771 RepID=A0A3G5AFQ3_9VIRU|nr:MAG: putative serine threonine-protein kinase [Satyrvirus sp.]